MNTISSPIAFDTTRPDTIRFDYERGTFTQARFMERIGLALMRLSAIATFPLHYKGMSVGVRIARALFPSDRLIDTRLCDNASFSFPYGDAYWSSLLNNRHGYCPVMEEVLRSFHDEDYAFIDCGANYGWFSALVSSQRYGEKPAIAIEAHPDTYAMLEKNASNNGNRFETLNRAVFSRSGEYVDMDSAKHEARSILDDGGDTLSGKIETIALDDLVPWLEKTGAQKTILKLDVEGVEIAAMQGASKLLERDGLMVIFECHGADREHTVSRFFQETLGMELFMLEAKRPVRVESLEALGQLKPFSHIGYDLAATCDSGWLKRLAAME